MLATGISGLHACPKVSGVVFPTLVAHRLTCHDNYKSSENSLNNAFPLPEACLGKGSSGHTQLNWRWIKRIRALNAANMKSVPDIVSQCDSVHINSLALQWSTCLCFQRLLCYCQLHSAPVGVWMKQMTSEETCVSATQRIQLRAESKYMKQYSVSLFHGGPWPAR